MGVPSDLFYSKSSFVDIFSGAADVLLFNQVALIHILSLPQANRQLFCRFLMHHFLQAHSHCLGTLFTQIEVLLSKNINTYLLKLALKD